MRQTTLIPSLGKLTPGQIFFGKRKISIISDRYNLPIISDLVNTPSDL